MLLLFLEFLTVQSIRALTYILSSYRILIAPFQSWIWETKKDTPYEEDQTSISNPKRSIESASATEMSCFFSAQEHAKKKMVPKQKPYLCGRLICFQKKPHIYQLGHETRGSFSFFLGLFFGYCSFLLEDIFLRKCTSYQPIENWGKMQLSVVLFSLLLFI